VFLYLSKNLAVPNVFASAIRKLISLSGGIVLILYYYLFRMKNLKFFLAITVLALSISSCGGRRDACPSVGDKVTHNTTNKVA
jgi:hypothetical protein